MIKEIGIQIHRKNTMKKNKIKKMTARVEGVVDKMI